MSSTFLKRLIVIFKKDFLSLKLFVPSSIGLELFQYLFQHHFDIPISKVIYFKYILKYIFLYVYMLMPLWYNNWCCNHKQNWLEKLYCTLYIYYYSLKSQSISFFPWNLPNLKVDKLVLFNNLTHTQLPKDNCKRSFDYLFIC